MKYKFMLLLTIALIISVGTFTTMAKNIFFKEPIRTQEVPSDVVWDTETGTYALKETPANAAETPAKSDIVKDKKYDWYNEHKNSKGTIDTALINWMDNVDPQLGLYSWYNPDEDVAFQKYVLPLGVENLPEIYERVSTDTVWDGFMMTTFAKITKIKDLEIVSITPEDKEKWLKNVKDKGKKAKEMYSLSEKNNQVDKKDEATIQSDLKEMGIFLLPYLDDQSEKGNSNMKKHVESLSVTDNDYELINSFIDTFVE